MVPSCVFESHKGWKRLVSVAYGLVAQGDAHEEEKQHDADQAEHHLEAVADERRQLP